MPKSPKQKQKLLYIAKYLSEKTNENCAVTTPQLISYLASNGISAERKSIYDDIETLCDFGYDIVKKEGPRGGYFLGSRDFELAEVKLLVDLVQSSKFITTKKSRELIKKLEKQVSQPEAQTLQRQVVVTDRNKTANETIYYSVDVIYEAIAKNVQIQFRYFEWDEHKQMQLRREGAFYEVSPWLLMWDDENYYLVAYDEKAKIMKHYRVDKMLQIALTDSVRQGQEEAAKIDVAAYSKKTFGMFAGDEKVVRMAFDKSLAGVVIGRFGQEVAMRPFGDSEVLVRASVQVSPQFFGWLAGFGNKVRIESPEDVKAAYADYIKSILDLYKE